MLELSTNVLRHKSLRLKLDPTLF